MSPNSHSAASRWEDRGKRPARIANCSGARSDPGFHMRRQAERGDVDFITGDYLAELNLPEHKLAMEQGGHDGWETTCWDGIEQTIDLIAEKRIKIIVNGGALNPDGLARKIQELINKRGYDLKVAYVTGDDLTEETKRSIASGQLPAHLDSENPNVMLNPLAASLKDAKSRPVITSHAYLGARGIVVALENGADIVICGRCADASPVIGAAWYWHNWKDTEYDKLAGALVAGHLIECSAYACGANFTGFDQYDLDTFVDLPFGIAEVDSTGAAIITKHDDTNGIINIDVMKCQFLYEIQGAIYLNSDVSADTTGIKLEDVGKNRVRVSGIKGYAPPPTTKLAVFYHAGFQAQLLGNAVGYGTEKKWQLFEKQMRFRLAELGDINKFDNLEFQVCGVPESNPTTQLRSTTYCRVFAQSGDLETCSNVLKAWTDLIMQHISGLHWSLDMRTAVPKPYIAFYPGLYDQNLIKEEAHILSKDGSVFKTVASGPPPEYYHLERRINFDADAAILNEFQGPTKAVRLGDIALGRSGDKGANCNFGIFPKSPAIWPWFRAFMSRDRLQNLIGGDWRDEYFIERMEFSEIKAVHFVIYGILGRGVLASTLLDNLGKGFTDYIRDKVIEVPIEVLSLATNGAVAVTNGVGPITNGTAATVNGH